MSALTVGSLFSGIGGLELGVEHATGGRVAFQVERDAWCREVLAKHWPDAVRYDDVCTVRGLPAVDILCGGFPCQDVSLAGKRAGFGGERSSLWREYRRIIADVGPRFVFVENVPGLLTADDGYAFAEVLGDLAALGFDAEWDVFRASDVGAPHRRERVFLLAHRDGERLESQRGGGLLDGERPTLGHDADGCGGAAPALADTAGVVVARPVADRDRCGRPETQTGDSGDGERWSRSLGDADGQRLQEPRRVGGLGGERSCVDGGRDVLPGAERGAESRLGAVPDGLSRGLDGHRWPAGRGEAQHPGEPPRTAAGVANRAPQLRAYGNAVVPQVAALAWRVLYARATGGAA